MDLGVRSRLRKGFSANICNQVVTVVVQLIGVPILLHAWGTQLYGEWLMLFAIPVYLSLTDLGLSQSAANDMTARVARGDRAGALVIFQSLMAFVFFATVSMFILTSFLIFGLHLENWMNFSAMRVIEVRWVLFLLAAGIFAQLPDGINHAGFRATGNYSLHLILNTTIRLVQFTAIWIAALSGGGPIAAAGAFFGVRAIATPAIALILVHRYHWLSFGFKHADRAELYRLFKPALANLSITFADGLNIQGMVLAVGGVLGSVAVVVFSTLRTLTRLIVQLVYSISWAVEPELAAAYGVRNTSLCNSLFVHMLSAGLWLALIAVAGLAFFGNSILAIWTRGRVLMHPTLFAWLLASAAASALWYEGLVVLKAANRHLRAAFVFVLSSAAAVGFGLFLMSWTGNVANAGLALLLTDSAMTLYALHAASRLIGTHPGSNLMLALNPLVGFRLVWKKHITAKHTDAFLNQ